MTDVIDLDRRFRLLTEKELEDADILAAISDYPYGDTLGWADLLKRQHVVLLAEAGAGKTVEMRAQTKRLVSAGSYAFFVPLEYLSVNPLGHSLTQDEAQLFQRWKQERAAPAWFFLDARDELKLTHGKLDQALLRLSQAIDGDISRAHVIISSRPHDWQPNVDTSIFLNRLPVSRNRAALPSSDDMFLAALEHDRTERRMKEEEHDVAPEAVATVILLPLSASQIETFTGKKLAQHAPDFLAELDAQNAWPFARRPLDLEDLNETWRVARRLGTRAEQHEANVTAKLKDDPDRQDRDVLANAKARDGAERLALALVLARARTIRSPEQAIAFERLADGVLDPAAALPDWTEAERQTLLRRALFDPATFGRVRFHHRSVQEYLAACHLRQLRDRGMSTAALRRLLFAERYGELVVVPSVRPIAAWLGLWDAEVRRELIAREPEVLLQHGDPGSIPIATRAELLRAFAASYGTGGCRGLNIPMEEVRRLAHPELASFIRELWREGTTNSDVRELLLELIWQGRIAECADLARAAALDASLDENDRVVAVRAVLACSRNDTAREIANSIISDPSSWPNKAVRRLARHLFPDIISVDELVVLIERTPESNNTLEGFGFALSQIVKTIDPAHKSAVDLRDRVAELIRNGRHAEPKVYCVSGRFDYLAPALAKLCRRQLEGDRPSFEPSHVRACVIASHSGTSNHSLPDEIAELRSHLRVTEPSREAAFWAEVEFLDGIEADKDDWWRLSRVEHYGLIGHLVESDRTWLAAGLTGERQPERRSLALTALVELWLRCGRSTRELRRLQELVKGDPDLEGIVAIKTAPREPSATFRELEREHEERQRQQAERRARQDHEWNDWRAVLTKDPAAAFADESRATTVRNLHAWLVKHRRHRNTYVVWDGHALDHVFGPDVSQRLANALRQILRENVPIMWSAQTERHATPYAWIYGLNGLAAEALEPDWSQRLSSEEARIAAAYATVDLNEIGSCITDLVSSHPAEVDDVLGAELSAQLEQGTAHSHLPLLQHLAYSDKGLKQLLTPRLLAALPSIPRNPDEETAARWVHHLNYFYRILQETSGEAERRDIAEICHERFQADPSGPLSIAWLQGLFHFDAQRAATAFIESIGRDGDPTASERAIMMFASLFGERDSSVLVIDDPSVRVRVLIDLIRCAYACVRNDDDQVHEGVFSPNTRDDAETGRGFLLSALLNTPGPEARDQILVLANDPNCAHFADRLRLYARERAAIDSEFPAFSADEIVALEKRHEAPPHDRDGLFELMMDRLDDLARYVAHGDFSDRRTLRTISEEVEMQRTLAQRLDAKQNGAFVVVREDEVADAKRTDIRLAAVRGGQKAVIEVKLAERWSLRDLERALRDQLVGQYLRHDSCQAGCLMLTYNGAKQVWIEPRTKRKLSFEQVVEYLRSRAEELERHHRYAIRLDVFGIDLTDPRLAPARETLRLTSTSISAVR